MYKTIEKMLAAMKSYREYDIDKKAAEETFEEVANKFLSNESLSTLELDYFYTFLGKYYPTNIGGELYPYPTYDEKLKPIYKNVADYFTKHLSENNVETITFLQYYYLTQMSKDHNITPIIRVDKKYFDEFPKADAMHFSEYIAGINRNIPVIAYNPEFIHKAYENPSLIPSVIESGFHELEHEVQQLQISSEKLTNPQALIWAKEHIVRKYILGEEYYKLNYLDIFHERDARRESYDRVKALGLQIAHPRISNYDLGIKHKENKDLDDVIAIDLLDILVTKYIETNPKILERYPVLKNIYDSEGIKKTLPQIEAEMEEQCERKIKDNPEKELEIREEYSSLIPRICETDNDLQFQYLCKKAAEFYSDNNMDSFNETVKQITDLLNKRELSYEQYIKKLEDRIRVLNKEAYKLLHPSNPADRCNYEKYLKVSKELKSTKFLLECIIEYNPEFKKKHNESVMKTTIKRELSKKLKHGVLEDYKGFVTDKGYIIYERKTDQEMFEDYRKAISELVDVATSRDELESDIKDLGIIYGDYIDLNNLSQYREKGDARK